MELEIESVATNVINAITGSSTRPTIWMLASYVANIQLKVMRFTFIRWSIIR